MIYLMGGRKFLDKRQDKFYRSVVELNGKRRFLGKKQNTKTASLDYGLRVVIRYKRLENYARLKEACGGDQTIDKSNE